MRGRRKTLVVILGGCLLFGSVAGVAGSSARVLVANCGTTGYLAFEPAYWSAGCTAGSPTIRSIEWTRYGGRVAVGVGTDLVEDCGCYDPMHVARYPARVVLSRASTCRGRRLRYFSKARFTITYPEGNPFGESAGDHSASSHVLRGECRFEAGSTTSDLPGSPAGTRPRRVR